MTQPARVRWAGLSSGVRKESFAGADLSAVSTRAPGGYILFDRVDFTAANFRLATLRAHFKMCSFVGADLRGADLRGSSFAGCDFADADFRDADLRTVRFHAVNTGADNGRTAIAGAQFEGARLIGTVFDDVVGPPPQF